MLARILRVLTPLLAVVVSVGCVASPTQPSPAGTPSSAQDYFARGKAEYEAGQWDQALSDFDKAIELDAQDAAAYSYRGEAYRQKGNLDQAFANQAKALYTTALELDPRSTAAYYHRGDADRQKGLKAEAIADMESYLKLAPNASNRAQVEGWIRELKGQ